jgi:hypothetical protein
MPGSRTSRIGAAAVGLKILRLNETLRNKETLSSVNKEIQKSGTTVYVFITDDVIKQFKQSKSRVSEKDSTKIKGKVVVGYQWIQAIDMFNYNPNSILNINPNAVIIFSYRR